MPEAGASWKGWREPGPASAADRIHQGQHAAQLLPDPPPSTASTPWIQPENGDSREVRRCL